MSWIYDFAFKNKGGKGQLDRTAKYIAHVGEVEFSGASESDTAGRRVKLRLIRAPEELGKVNPFAKFTRRRKGHVGSRFDVSFAEIDGSKEFMAETWLADWGDSPKGSTITLALNAESATHPFMYDRRASKEQAGTRYVATFVERGDDEVFIAQDKVERAEQARRTGRQQTLSNAARIMAKSQRFRDWLGETTDIRDWSIANADQWLKDEVGIESKAELDDERTPESAAKIIKFHRVRTRFIDWQESQGDSHDHY